MRPCKLSFMFFAGMLLGLSCLGYWLGYRLSDSDSYATELKKGRHGIQLKPGEFRHIARENGYNSAEYKQDKFRSESKRSHGVDEGRNSHNNLYRDLNRKPNPDRNPDLIGSVFGEGKDDRGHQETEIGPKLPSKQHVVKSALGNPNGIQSNAKNPDPESVQSEQKLVLGHRESVAGIRQGSEENGKVVFQGIAKADAPVANPPQMPGNGVGNVADLQKMWQNPAQESIEWGQKAADVKAPPKILPSNNQKSAQYEQFKTQDRDALVQNIPLDSPLRRLPFERPQRGMAQAAGQEMPGSHDMPVPGIGVANKESPSPDRDQGQIIPNQPQGSDKQVPIQQVPFQPPRMDEQMAVQFPIQKAPVNPPGMDGQMAVRLPIQQAPILPPGVDKPPPFQSPFQQAPIQSPDMNKHMPIPGPVEFQQLQGNFPHPGAVRGHGMPMNQPLQPLVPAQGKNPNFPSQGQQLLGNEPRDMASLQRPRVAQGAWGSEYEDDAQQVPVTFYTLIHCGVSSRAPSNTHGAFGPFLDGVDASAFTIESNR